MLGRRLRPTCRDSAATRPYPPQFDTLAITGFVTLVTQGFSTRVGTVGIASARLPMPISFPPSPMPTEGMPPVNR